MYSNILFPPFSLQLNWFSSDEEIGSDEEIDSDE